MIRRWRIPLLVFAAILIHGATIGLTDDEAYYWVLAQKPALGYAYHPPAVALLIAAAQAALGWLGGHHCVALVRLPAAACAALLVALGQRWVGRAVGWSGDWAEHEGAAARERAGLVIAAFAGMFALAWMMVPDLPLFVGWMLAFGATWEICFAARARGQGLLLAAGLALAILSKYSGVLAAVSAAGAIWAWAPRERRRAGLLAIVAGGLLAAAPILWWNSQHEWASILYQIRERHGEAHLSALRYARFAVIELVLAGPALAYYGIALALHRRHGRAERFCLAWAAPAIAVFFTQPWWSDFKPHWALIAWWPLVLALAFAWARGERPRIARVHCAYGFTLTAAVWLCCHWPIAAGLFAKVAQDPRLDVTNDLYGWGELRARFTERYGEGALRIPFIGGRYQTAAQAAFALGEGTRATLLPRDLKSLDEWPDLSVSEEQGPDWPRLMQTVWFVADNRYDAGPEFKRAACAQVDSFETRRAGHLAKTIYLWKCEPGLSFSPR